jgi:ribosome-binding protein aMBF1 (putative translation factor)
MNNLQKAIEAKRIQQNSIPPLQTNVQYSPLQQTQQQQMRIQLQNDMQNNIQELATLIRITRNQQMLSQRELANMIGYSQATITRAEKGTVAYTTLFIIASALGTKLTLTNK